MKLSNIIFILFFILLFVFGCSSPTVKVSEPEPEENTLLVSKGETIALELVQTLKKEVKQAIDSNGVVAAINLCNEKAIPITDDVANNHSENISIKRISFKYRNPANRPDEIETAALNYFENLIEQGEQIPLNHTQKVMENGHTTFYYYKPMKMENLCLLCHGTDATVSPDVRDVLSKFYPDDNATGYKEGDFRGLIRVKLTSL